MANGSLIKQWRAARDDLGIQIHAPHEVKVGGRATIRAKLLVRHFGAARGMLVVGDEAEVAAHADQLQRMGYGYSVFLDNATYTRRGFIRILRDWGWTGPEAARPAWLSRRD